LAKLIADYGQQVDRELGMGIGETAFGGGGEMPHCERAADPADDRAGFYQALVFEPQELLASRLTGNAKLPAEDGGRLRSVHFEDQQEAMGRGVGWERAIWFA
jgi:hypothetical protein